MYFDYYYITLYFNIAWCVRVYTCIDCSLAHCNYLARFYFLNYVYCFFIIFNLLSSNLHFNHTTNNNNNIYHHLLKHYFFKIFIHSVHTISSEQEIHFSNDFNWQYNDPSYYDYGVGDSLYNNNKKNWNSIENSINQNFITFTDNEQIQMLTENDYCIITRNGVQTHGTCLSASKCAEALNQFNKGIKPIICSYLPHEPVICCPQASLRPTQTPTQSQTLPPPPSPSPPPPQPSFVPVFSGNNGGSNNNKNQQNFNSNNNNNHINNNINLNNRDSPATRKSEQSKYMH